MDSLCPVIHTTTIKPEWLDYNDHLNVTYYLLIFDQAGEVLVASLGLGEGGHACNRDLLGGVGESYHL